MANENDPRTFWEGRNPGPALDTTLDAYERDLTDGVISNEMLGIFLHDRMGNHLRTLGDGLYAHDHPQTGAHSLPPLPHDLAARYLRQCAAALERLAALEARRAE